MLRYQIGEIVEMAEYKADSLIKAGVAEMVGSSKEAKTEKVVKK